MTKKKKDNVWKETISSIVFPLGFVGVMWIVFLLQTFVGFSYKVHGIIPRKIYGLKGILTAPLLHGDIGHILSNTVPFIALSSILFVLYKRVAYGSFFMIYFLTGILVWLLAKPANHIGASGIVYGLVAFIFWTGIFRKNRKAIVLSLLVLVVYSGYFVGIVPGKEGISWESHLLGALSGIVTAFLFRSLIEDDEKTINPWLNQAVTEKEYMFKRDIFDYTMSERRAQRSAVVEDDNFEKDRFEEEWDVNIDYEVL